MAQFDIAPGVTYADRQAWGADTDLPRLGDDVSRNRRTHVIVHHTVRLDSGSTPNLWEGTGEVFGQMRSLQVARPDLGRDVPYNFVVFLMNTTPASIVVCEGRGEDRSGAHTVGHNTRGIGLSFEGDFENHNEELTRYIPLVSLFLGWLKFDPNGPGYGGPHAPLHRLGELAPSDRKVFAHRDFKATACPGRFLLPHLRQMDFADPRVEL